MEFVLNMDEDGYRGRHIFGDCFFIIDNILSKKSEVLDMSNLSRGQVRIENT